MAKSNHSINQWSTNWSLIGKNIGTTASDSIIKALANQSYQKDGKTNVNTAFTSPNNRNPAFVILW